jgi:DNA polymerase-3 subunit delta'
MRTVLGHADILKYLTEGIRRQRLSPSLLFVGPEGVGKKRVAHELTALLKCDPVSDFLLVDRPLQASLLKEKPESQTAIKIESVRHLDKFLRLRPADGSYRVAVIDEADRLTEEAANALLKILEEPPRQTQIVLLAVDARNMPSTVASRCAVLRFRPLPAGLIQEWLEKEQSLSSSEAARVAARSDGSFAKALRVLKENEAPDLSTVTPDEFFSWLSEPAWKKEGRARATEFLNRLIEETDPLKSERRELLLAARRQIDRHVPPRLVLGNLFVKLEPVFAKAR